MKRIIALATIIYVFAAISAAFAQKEAEVGKPFPKWTPGMMDIHAVNASSGECTVMVFPDGTTMMVDAGESKSDAPNMTPQRPNDEQAPYITYTNYLRRILKQTGHKEADYALLTHFHIDHFGEVNKGTPLASNGAYRLSGLIGVGDAVHFNTIIDRDYPAYDTPLPPVSKAFKNWHNFVTWQRDNAGSDVQRFVPGRADQIVLRHDADKYPTFQVRNIASNGEVWTGVADVTRHYFIPSKWLDKKSLPDENQSSIAMRVSYGKFDYFTGGDLPAVTNEPWQCIEVPVGTACGPVEVMKANHHMNYDANGVEILRALRPRVVVAHTRKAQQPDIQVLRRIQSGTRAYPGDKDVFTTNLHPATPLFAYPNTEKLGASQGHIVVRVMPGGDEFYVYCLEDADESMTVKSVHGPYQCN